MPVGLYSTTELNGIVRVQKRVPSFFLDTFFGEVKTHTTEDVHIDYDQDKPRITPFVAPKVKGKLVEALGYSTRVVKPAYLKDIRVFNPDKALQRLAGEQIGGSLTPQQRMDAVVTAEIQDQMRMFYRRMEVMAVEAIVRGTQTIAGDGFATAASPIVVNYGRAGGNTITLTAGDTWDNAGAPIIDQFEAASEIVDNNDGSVEMVIMNSVTFRKLRKTTVFSKEVDLNVRNTSSVVVSPQLMEQGRVKFRGMLGAFAIYTYDWSYIDPADGSTKKLLLDNEVIFAGRAVEGVRHFGMIQDLKSMEATEMFAKMWEEEEPSARFMSLASAPLMVPYRPNATVRMVVA